VEAEGAAGALVPLFDGGFAIGPATAGLVLVRDPGSLGMALVLRPGRGKAGTLVAAERGCGNSRTEAPSDARRANNRR